MKGIDYSLFAKRANNFSQHLREKEGFELELSRLQVPSENVRILI